MGASRNAAFDPRASTGAKQTGFSAGSEPVFGVAARLIWATTRWICLSV
jgi:hypothetical protein